MDHARWAEEQVLAIDPQAEEQVLASSTIEADLCKLPLNRSDIDVEGLEK